MSECTNMLSTIKDLVNIIFFIVTGLLAFFSYLNARKTLFSPIKTEVFKLQIKEFEIILDKFRKYDEKIIMKKFDEEKILFINACSIITGFFNYKFKKDIVMRGFDRNESYGFIISSKNIDQYVEEVKLIRSDKDENNEPNKEKWEDRDLGILSFTKKFERSHENIIKLSNTPILPEKISHAIKEVVKTEDRNLSIMMEVLSDFSKDLPNLIKQENDIQRIDFKGLYNIYNGKRTRVSPYIDTVKSEIKNYLKVEKIIH